MRRSPALAALLLLAAQTPPAAPLSFDRTPEQGALVTGRVTDADVAAIELRTFNGARTPVTLADGRFMVGLDRDAPADETLVVMHADGREEAASFPVAPRAWRIERVDALYHPPGFDARRPAELARIAAARASETGERGWLEPLRWPLAGPIRGLFGAQRIYRGTPGSYHGGIDLAAPAGTPVRAPGAGRVTLVADPPFTLEGRLLLIDHGGGLTSALMHLSRIDVRVGDVVTAGQVVGAVGATGRATGPHLHWGLTWRGARLDPLLAAER